MFFAFTATRKSRNALKTAENDFASTPSTPKKLSGDGHQHQHSWHGDYTSKHVCYMWFHVCYMSPPKATPKTCMLHVNFMYVLLVRCWPRFWMKSQNVLKVVFGSQSSFGMRSSQSSGIFRWRFPLRYLIKLQMSASIHWSAILMLLKIALLSKLALTSSVNSGIDLAEPMKFGRSFCSSIPNLIG